jgi:hypothetical protein
VVYAASRSGVLVLATTNDSATSPRPLGTLPRPRTAYQASVEVGPGRRLWEYQVWEADLEDAELLVPAPGRTRPSIEI